ncbi:MAG: hypothetical protein R2706_11420 [Acidimicrobiales bacterium]
MSTVAAVVRHEVCLLKRDPMPLAVLLIMPLIVMAFVMSAFKSALVAGGYPTPMGQNNLCPAWPSV